MKVEWFNFRTDEWEFISGELENMKDFIPQSHAAQGLYALYIALGNEPKEAAKKVLMDVLQIEHD